MTAEASRDRRRDWSSPVGLRAVEPKLLLEATWSVLRGRHRSLTEDARRVADRMEPPPRVSGLDQVPAVEPFVLVANHFQVPGMWVGWVAAAITAAVAGVRDERCRELHWVVISEWRWLEMGGIWIPNPLTTAIFPRACRSWGLIPMPPRPSDVAGRARALREVLSRLGYRRPAGGPPPEPVGFFPEGRATVALAGAKPGTGAFLHKVSSLGVRLLPTGVHQHEGVLSIRFGAPFFLPASLPDDREELDEWARERVMVSIGRLLPRELWGAYSRAISEEA